jgi:hypothetical protein
VLANIYGPVFVPLGLVSLALSVWALVDAVVRPSWAFQSAGRSKTLWVVLEIVGLFFCGPVLALIYLVGIRPGVARQQRYPGGWMPPPSQPTGPPPGWFPDPTGTGKQRYWDGSAWTEHTRST